MIIAVVLAGVISIPLSSFVAERLAAVMTPPAASSTAPAPAATDRSSLLGSSVAMFVALTGIVIIMPWKVRPSGTWITLWLASTVGRLLFLPVVGLAVYSAAPVRTDVFLLSLAGTYLACLAAEVAVTARSVARSLEAAEAEVRSRSASS